MPNYLLYSSIYLLQKKINLDQSQKEKVKENALKKVQQKDLDFLGITKNKDDQSTIKKYENEEEELRDLFDQIMLEIDERQQYLEDIKDLNEPKIKDKLKKEIIERVGELQKITKMREKLKTKNTKK